MILLVHFKGGIIVFSSPDFLINKTLFPRAYIKISLKMKALGKCCYRTWDFQYLDIVHCLTRGKVEAGKMSNLGTVCFYCFLHPLEGPYTTVSAACFTFKQLACDLCCTSLTLIF